MTLYLVWHWKICGQVPNRVTEPLEHWNQLLWHAKLRDNYPASKSKTKGTVCMIRELDFFDHGGLPSLHITSLWHWPSPGTCAYVRYARNSWYIFLKYVVKRNLMVPFKYCICYTSCLGDNLRRSCKKSSYHKNSGTV